MIMAAKGGHDPRHHPRRLPPTAQDKPRALSRRDAPQPVALPAAVLGWHLPCRRTGNRADNPCFAGQLSVEQLVGRYNLVCRPVRDLLADLPSRTPTRGRLQHVDRAGHRVGPALLEGPGETPPRHRLAAAQSRHRRRLETADADRFAESARPGAIPDPGAACASAGHGAEMGENDPGGVVGLPALDDQGVAIRRVDFGLPSQVGPPR